MYSYFITLIIIKFIEKSKLKRQEIVGGDGYRGMKNAIVG